MKFKLIVVAVSSAVTAVWFISKQANSSQALNLVLAESKLALEAASEKKAIAQPINKEGITYLSLYGGASYQLAEGEVEPYYAGYPQHKTRAERISESHLKDGRHAVKLKDFHKEEKNDELDNALPTVNKEIKRRIQAEINQWQWTADIPTHRTLSLVGLFEDPEKDNLSVRIDFSAPGMNRSNYPLINIYGTPTNEDVESRFVVSVRDDHHGDNGWIGVVFGLPTIQETSGVAHQLEGKTFYRLETSNSLAGELTPYEVVYCQAFKLTDNQVYFAASNTKTRCPSDDQLKAIGDYRQDRGKLIINAQSADFYGEQTWEIKHQYQSKQQFGLTNYFVTVVNGQQVESYTLQKDKTAMERRLNNITGQEAFQIRLFDHLLPLDDRYVQTQIGHYIYDHQTEVVGPNDETLNSALHISAGNRQLSCSDVALWYESGQLGGKNSYGEEMISTNTPSSPAYAVNCQEISSGSPIGQTSLAFDLNFSPYDKLADGEIYSYVLKPKAQFAGQVEEIKLNFIYQSK